MRGKHCVDSSAVPLGAGTMPHVSRASKSPVGVCDVECVLERRIAAMCSHHMLNSAKADLQHPHSQTCVMMMPVAAKTPHTLTREDKRGGSRVCFFFPRGRCGSPPSPTQTNSSTDPRHVDWLQYTVLPVQVVT